jgi:hypothetical protein
MASENIRRHRTIALRQRGALSGKSCHEKLLILAAEVDGGRPDLVAAKRYVAGN